MYVISMLNSNTKVTGTNSRKQESNNVSLDQFALKAVLN